MISIIVPLYNEGDGVTRLIAHLRGFAGVGEVVLVDASDEAASLAVIDMLVETLRGDRLVRLVKGVARGRAVQMNYGVGLCRTGQSETSQSDTSQPETNQSKTSQSETSQSDTSQSETDQPEISQSKTNQSETNQPETSQPETNQPKTNQPKNSTLLFLHCDTRLPQNAVEHIYTCIAEGYVWGRFDLRLDARGVMYRLIERMINLRSRLCGIATGDQAMFIQRRVFEQQDGFAEIALMEDVDISRRLKRVGAPARIVQPVLTSARRWQKSGVVCTLLLMWKLRWLYWLGRNPERLALRYRDVR